VSLELVIERDALGARAGLVEDGQLIDLLLADDAPERVGDRIFLARVRATGRMHDGTFLDLGTGSDALLSARDARWLGVPPQEGRAVLVQGLREASGDKGPRVTADVALPGARLVLHPRRDDVRLSPRLAHNPAGAEQRARGLRLFPDGGVLLRSAASGVSDQALCAEAESLGELWRAIEARAGSARAPACLHDTGEPLARVLGSLPAAGLRRIVVGDRATLRGVAELLRLRQPGVEVAIELVADAFTAHGIGEQIEQALERVVPLAGGGRLIIEPTAALTAIDVDGAGRAALDVDLEAVAEIARQARLRRLGGTIVVDFVDLPGKEQRARLREALRRAFHTDPEPVQILPMTALGLVQISRRRRRPPLALELGRPCPTCEGGGMLLGLRWRSQALLRELGPLGAARGRIRIAPDLSAFLGRRDNPTAGELRRAAPLWRLEADPALPPGAWRIDPETLA
jgi:ribonuclease G